jgi:hypothetical protein
MKTALSGRWHITSVTNDSERYDVTTCPGLSRGFLSFHDDGLFAGNTTVNILSGRYEVVPSGFRVIDGSVTLRGYGGDDPAIIMAQQAMHNTATGADIAVRVTGDEMVVTVLDVEIHLAVRISGSSGFRV